MVEFARALPALRERVARRPRRAATSARDHVLACAVRLLDRGFFRIGSEDYAVTNETYGLATMKKRHVARATATGCCFDYPAKHGKRRVQAVVDPRGRRRRSQRLKRRRGGGDELLAYKARPAAGRDVRSPDINAYLKDATGVDVSRQGLPHVGRDRAGGRRAGRRRPGAEHEDRRASGRSRARSRRSPTTWATRRRSRARPTSTRGCSTATATASRSPRVPGLGDERRRDRDPGPGGGGGAGSRHRRRPSHDAMALDRRRGDPASRRLGLGRSFLVVERRDGLVAAGADREDLVEAGDLERLGDVWSTLTIVRRPSRERRRLTVPMRTPSAVESRNVVSSRSTTIRGLPASMPRQRCLELRGGEEVDLAAHGDDWRGGVERLLGEANSGGMPS